MNQTIKDKLKEIIVESSKNVEKDQITLESNLVRDFGFVSMNFIQLIAELELQFDIEISDDDLLFEELADYSKLLELLESKVSVKP